MGLPENLDTLLVKYDITAESLARIAEVDPSSVSRWRNGSQIRKEPLRKICEYFGLTEDDILSPSIGLAAKEHGCAFDSNHVCTPLYGSIAAGTPIEMLDVEDKFPIPRELSLKFPNAFLLKVEGDSMNRILPNGCYALIDPCSDIAHDMKPYAVCVNGYDATIKRVRKLNNGFDLVPDSTDPTYAVKTFNYNEPGTETVTVIGRVVYYVLPYDWSF